MRDLAATAQAEDLEHQANAYKARLLVDAGLRAERANQPTQARDAYAQSLALDPTNAAAAEGRNRMLAYLGQTTEGAPALTRSEQAIVVQQQEIRYNFDDAVAQANAAVQGGNFDEAEAQFERSRAAAATNPGIFDNATVRRFNTTLNDLRLRIDQSHQAAAERTDGDREVAQLSRIRAQQQAAQRQREGTVSQMVIQARRLTDDARYEQALGVVDQIRRLDPKNDYAAGIQPLLQDKVQWHAFRDAHSLQGNGFERQTGPAGRSSIPYDDILRYPGDWPDIRREVDELRSAYEQRGNATAAEMSSQIKSLSDQIARFQARFQTVVRSRSSIGNVPYATISLGSADNVQRGMRFRLVDRAANRFLGYLTIDRVGEQESTGRMEGPHISEVRLGTEVVGNWDTEAGARAGAQLAPAMPAAPTGSDKTAQRTLATPVRLPPDLVYRRPSVNLEPRLFSDLLAYAPGMDTSEADVLAVLDAEAEPTAATSPGRIDPAARRLIDAARAVGWRQVKVPATRTRAAFMVTFDGAGRFAWERQVGLGLTERVVCDGQTLWHLYPDLGVAARRTVSRFHRAEFARLVPWALPPVDDLARGADVLLVGERTVAIDPHRDGTPEAQPPSPGTPGEGGGEGGSDHQVHRNAGAPGPQNHPHPNPLPEYRERGQDARPSSSTYYRVLLTFGPDGQLVGRSRVEMPSGRVLHREAYDASGKVRSLKSDDSVELEQNLVLRSADAPDLAPHADELVVLPLPYRSREHVWRERKLKLDNNDYASWSSDDALAAIAADLARPVGDTASIIVRKFFRAGDRRLGLYTLLLSSSYTWDPAVEQVLQDGKRIWADPLRDHPDSPLAHYIAQQLVLNREGTRRDAAEFKRIDHMTRGFIGRLAVFRGLVNRWTSGRAGAAPELDRLAEFWEAMAFADACPDPYVTWATASVLRERLVEGAAAATPSMRTPTARKLMRLIEPLADLPGLEYANGYEHAGLLCAGGDVEKCRAAFAALYRDTLKEGTLPPIDTKMLQAFDAPVPYGVGGSPSTQPAANGRSQWAGLVHEAATALAARGDRAAMIDLARQCNDLGDAALANELTERALAFAAAGPERFDVTLAAVELLADTREFALAEQALRPLLDDPKFGRIPELWRLASVLAGRQGKVARSLACRERAMALEFDRRQSRQEEIDLSSFRKEYADLLSGYEQLASAAQALDADAPREVVQQIVRAADRWRSIDPDPAEACQAAGRALRRLGAADLAWDYLTTPLAGQSTESAAWQKLARELKSEQDFALADRAYGAAFDAEPTNPQFLWDRAELLQQWGKADLATQLRRRIADGDWQPRFASLQAQAKEYLRR